MTDVQSPLVALLSEWQNEARVLVAALGPVEHPEGVLPREVVERQNAGLRRLRWTMIPRETRKQRVLWPVVRRHLDDGRTAIDELAGRKRVFERELLRLRWADEHSVLFDEQLTVLIGYVMSYVQFEQQLLPRLGSQVPAAEQDRVTQRLTAPGSWLPVQPHPDLPASSAFAAVIAPFVAVLDRLRDRLSTAPG